MKKRKIVSMIGALVLIISAAVLITGCPAASSSTPPPASTPMPTPNPEPAPNPDPEPTPTPTPEPEPEESNPVIGVWQQMSNKSVYWVFFETGEFCMAKYQSDESLGIRYTRTAMGFYKVEGDYIELHKGSVQFEKITAGDNTFLKLANGKQTLRKVSSPSFDEIRDAPETMPLP